MSLDHDLERAQQAKQLLDNPVYQEAIENVRSAIVAAWSGAPIRDTEGHHELKLMLKLLTDLEANINRVLTDGKIAQIEIERQKKPFGEKVRKMWR
jgi:hypothetical protein